MKLTVKTLILLFVLSSCCSCNTTRTVQTQVSQANQLSAQLTPPGTIKVKNYYIDQTEVHNLHWLEFIQYKKEAGDSLAAYRLQPSSANTGFALPENRHKPIVLITYEQAVEYCAWRSEKVRELHGINVTYRLPTAMEWKVIAEEVLKQDRKQQEQDLLNTRKLLSQKPGEYYMNSATVRKNRTYNLFDNVSEMTAQKGLALGNSNKKLDELSSNLTKEVQYNAADAYLGFRCIAVLE